MDFLHDQFLTKYAQAPAPLTTLGETTYWRTYSRNLWDQGRKEQWWQTVARVVEGTFQTLKIHCHTNHCTWSQQRAERTAREMYDRIYHFKFTPPGRGLDAMGSEAVAAHGAAVLNNCFSGDTRFVVDRNGGIDSFTNRMGMQVEVLCSDNRWRLAIVRSFSRQVLQRVTFRPYGLRSNYRLNYDVTPNHTWILSNGMRTTNLALGDVIRITPQTITDNDDYRMGFIHGLIFGDGTRHTYYPDRHFIRLCGPKNLAYRSILEQHEGYISTTYPPTYYGDAVVTIRSAINMKTLPAHTTTLNYKQGFLAGWIAADGHMKSSGSVCLDSQDSSSLEWVIERAPLLGYTITGDHTESTMDTNFGTRKSPLRRLSLLKGPCDYVLDTIEPLNEQEVFCVTEPQTSSFTLTGGVCTGNCGFITTEKPTPEIFAKLFDLEMLRVGVGYDTLGVTPIYAPLTHETYIYVIPDTREGWAESVRLLLASYMTADSPSVYFNYDHIRQPGLPIKRAGGTSSGAGPLIRLHESLRVLCNEYVGRMTDSAWIVDCCTLIGRCVIAGNVRKSAQIALGRHDDTLFHHLKMDSAKVVDHRSFSNNSILAHIGMDYTTVAKLTAETGEPGYLWLDNCQAYGRMNGQLPTRSDFLVRGTNPCSEQSLEPHELCNLVETYPAHHADLDDYLRTLKLAYLYAKTVTLLPTGFPETDEIIARNRRIGCSMSGITQAMAKLGASQFIRWCNRGYDFLTGLDASYSDWLKVPESIKRTSVKPSGTVSILANATPGIHYPHSEYYLRRIRIQSNSKLLPLLDQAGYTIVPEIYGQKKGQEDTMVVEFPIHEQHYTKGKAQATMFEQLALAAMMQKYWADNQVSITVHFTKEEAKDIPLALEIYQHYLKSVSFLPYDPHQVYALAPYETIDEAQYAKRVEQCTKPILPYDCLETGVQTGGCDTDRCELVQP